MGERTSTAADREAKSIEQKVKAQEIRNDDRFSLNTINISQDISKFHLRFAPSAFCCMGMSHIAAMHLRGCVGSEQEIFAAFRL
jgi:hypothetical protein